MLLERYHDENYAFDCKQSRVNLIRSQRKCPQSIMVRMRLCPDKSYQQQQQHNHRTKQSMTSLLFIAIVIATITTSVTLQAQLVSGWLFNLAGPADLMAPPNGADAIQNDQHRLLINSQTSQNINLNNNQMITRGQHFLSPVNNHLMQLTPSYSNSPAPVSHQMRSLSYANNPISSSNFINQVLSDASAPQHQHQQHQPAAQPQAQQLVSQSSPIGTNVLTANANGALFSPELSLVSQAPSSNTQPTTVNNEQTQPQKQHQHQQSQERASTSSLLDNNQQQGGSMGNLAQKVLASQQPSSQANLTSAIGKILEVVGGSRPELLSTNQAPSTITNDKLSESNKEPSPSLINNATQATSSTKNNAKTKSQDSSSLPDSSQISSIRSAGQVALNMLKPRKASGQSGDKSKFAAQLEETIINQHARLASLSNRSLDQLMSKSGSQSTTARPYVAPPTKLWPSKQSFVKALMMSPNSNQIQQQNNNNANGKITSSPSAPSSSSRADWSLASIGNLWDRLLSGAGISQASGETSRSSIVKAISDTSLSRTLSSLGKTLGSNKYVAGTAAASVLAALGLAMSKMVVTSKAAHSPFASFQGDPLMPSASGQYSRFIGNSPGPAGQNSLYGPNVLRLPDGQLLYTIQDNYQPIGQPQPTVTSPEFPVNAYSTAYDQQQPADQAPGTFVSYLPADQSSPDIGSYQADAGSFASNHNQNPQLIANKQQNQLIDGAQSEMDSSQSSHYQVASSFMPHHFDATMPQSNGYETNQQRQQLGSDLNGHYASHYAQQPPADNPNAMHFMMPPASSFQSNNNNYQENSFMNNNKMRGANVQQRLHQDHSSSYHPTFNPFNPMTTTSDQEEYATNNLRKSVGINQEMSNLRYQKASSPLSGSSWQPSARRSGAVQDPSKRAYESVSPKSSRNSDMSPQTTTTSHNKFHRYPAMIDDRQPTSDQAAGLQIQVNGFTKASSIGNNVKQTKLSRFVPIVSHANFESLGPATAYESDDLGLSAASLDDASSQGSLAAASTNSFEQSAIYNDKQLEQAPPHGPFKPIMFKSNDLVDHQNNRLHASYSGSMQDHLSFKNGKLIDANKVSPSTASSKKLRFIMERPLDGRAVVDHSWRLTNKNDNDKSMSPKNHLMLMSQAEESWKPDGMTTQFESPLGGRLSSGVSSRWKTFAGGVSAGRNDGPSYDTESVVMSPQAPQSNSSGGGLFTLDRAGGQLDSGWRPANSSATAANNNINSIVMLNTDEELSSTIPSTTTTTTSTTSTTTTSANNDINPADSIARLTSDETSPESVFNQQRQQRSWKSPSTATGVGIVGRPAVSHNPKLLTPTSDARVSQKMPFSDLPTSSTISGIQIERDSASSTTTPGYESGNANEMSINIDNDNNNNKQAADADAAELKADLTDGRGGGLELNAEPDDNSALRSTPTDSRPPKSIATTASVQSRKGKNKSKSNANNDKQLQLQRLGAGAGAGVELGERRNSKQSDSQTEPTASRLIDNLSRLEIGKQNDGPAEKNLDLTAPDNSHKNNNQNLFSSSTNNKLLQQALSSNNMTPQYTHTE